MTNQKLGPFQTAQYLARIGVFTGIFLGLCYAFIGLVADLLTIGVNAGTWMAFGAILGMPILGALGGWLVGIIWGQLRELLRL